MDTWTHPRVHETMWIATVDFAKSLGYKISRGNIVISMKSQRQQSIHVPFEEIVRNSACHRLDGQRERRAQNRKGGTKEGDPLSSLWFNTGLQSALEDDLRILREKGMGDQQCDCLSNLRFADDVLLFSSSLNQLKKMMSDFK